MKDSLISVIIPVYNVENYLKECIESVCNQSYRNLQIILIDDGSNDNSGKICDQYRKLDTRIEVVHQENRGVSFARNVGIKRAKGEWVAFCDSDDVLPDNAYEKLYSYTYGSDLVMGEIQLISETGERQKKVNTSQKGSSSAKDFLKELFKEEEFFYLGYPGDKLYKKRIIDQHNILFTPQIKVNEDRLFVMEYVMKCNTITFCNEIVLFYRQREEGVINSTRRNETITDSEITVILSFEKMKELGNFYSDDLYYLVVRKAFECGLDLINRVSKYDKVKKRYIKKFFRENGMKCLNNPQYSIKEKIKIIGHMFLEK